MAKTDRETEGPGKGDPRTGAVMLRRALEEPLRRIAVNAGLEGSVIVEEVRKRGAGVGYDANKGDYTNMVEAGIIDPLKVTRSALENAASIATMILTTETLITEVSVWLDLLRERARKL